MGTHGTRVRDRGLVVRFSCIDKKCAVHVRPVVIGERVTRSRCVGRMELGGEKMRSVGHTRSDARGRARDSMTIRVVVAVTSRRRF